MWDKTTVTSQGLEYLKALVGVLHYRYPSLQTPFPNLQHKFRQDLRVGSTHSVDECYRCDVVQVKKDGDRMKVGCK